MARILGIDYGEKRTGLAITDAMAIIASPLETVETRVLMQRLEQLIAQQDVRTIVVGEARYLDGTASRITGLQAQFVAALSRRFPAVRIERVDEMFTSKMAARALVEGGMKKSDRQKKENLDKVSAAILLQSWMDAHPER